MAIKRYYIDYGFELDDDPETLVYVGTATEVSRLERKMRERETVWFEYTEPARYNPGRLYALVTETRKYGPGNYVRVGTVIRAETVFLCEGNIIKR